MVALTDAASSREEARRVTLSIIERCETYLRDEIRVSSTRDHVVDCSPDCKNIRLRDLTAMVSVVARMPMLIAFTFNRSLICQVLAVTAEDIEIEDDEREEFEGEAAGDMINVIIGNTTSQMSPPGHRVSLSPPVILKGAETMSDPRSEASVHTVTLKTTHGDLDIIVVAPHDHAAFRATQE